MPSLEEAILLAMNAHHNQTDKAGQPYILHPLRVMFRLDSDAEKIVGVLHDVVEDSELSLADIRNMGYSEEIVAALDGVTRRGDETYAQFVERSGQNPISRRVKLADLEDNMDLRRLGNSPTKKDLERLARYRQAWGRLRQTD